MDDNIVIVGGSIAGIFAAKELRKKGYQGGIKIVESEERLPYDKPPLTKEWMQDNENTAIPLLEKENFYDDNNIEIVLNTKIINIDTDKKQLLTESNKIINYDKLVLATGVKNKKLNYSNQNLNIHYLSNFLDALSIKEKVSKEKQDIVILGGGFIGLELAASLKNLSHNVTLISRSEYPLSKIIGNQAAKYIKQLHEKNGVNFITNDTIKEIEGKDTVKKITTANNREIKCNILIAGIGTFFEEIRNQGVEKLNTNNQGYIVNEYGQTNIQDVYAIGDCAVWPYDNKLINVKHWENAFNQGKNLAKNIINKNTSPFKVIPYFWSDQYNDSFEYLGHIKNWNRSEIEGNIENGMFSITYYDQLDKPQAVFFTNGYKNKKEVQDYLIKNKA